MEAIVAEDLSNRSCLSLSQLKELAKELPQVSESLEN